MLQNVAFSSGSVCTVYYMGLVAAKPVFGGFANNKNANEPAHPRRLISTFVIRLLEIIISQLASSEISIFQLVSVAKETGLSLALSETPKTGFLTSRHIYMYKAHV